MLAHLRHSLRLWRRTPIVSAAIILTLAIAIGANTAAFSVIRAVLLDPLPYPEADRLAILWTDDPAHNVHTEGVSYPNYADWRAMNRSFSDLAFFIRTDYSQVNITGGEAPERVQAALVSSNFLQVARVAPAYGRGFTEEDMKTKSNVVLIGEGLARRRFGSAEVAGHTIQVEGSAATIIGVMPASFHFPTADTEIWRPYTQLVPYQPAERAFDYLCILGRLKPGVSIATARGDMAEIGRRLEKAYPNMPRDFAGFGVNVVPLYEHVYGRNTRPALLLILCVVICVLLIAVTNVANLLLANLEAREQEFAVRTALGAGLSRLTRQVLAEAGLLATLGAALGIALAGAGLRLVIHTFAGRLPRLDQARLDWGALAVTIAITAGACFAAVLPPIAQLRRELFAEAIRKRASTPLKRGLAITQVALATALLSATGLLLHSYSLVSRTPLGYRPDHLLVFELVTRANSAAAGNTHSIQVAEESRRRIRALPGVLGVANAGDLFLRRNPDWEIWVEGRDLRPDGSPLADDIVTADFFRVMGAPLIAGRLFTPEEERDSKRSVVIVNEAMARKYWGIAKAVGQRFATSPPGSKQTWRTVIGVVGNMQIANREAAPMPEMYWATADYPDLKFVVRTASDPNALLAAIRHEVQTVDAGAVVYRPTTVEAQIDRWMGPRRMNASLVGIFSVIAAILAGIGVFSLLHYATAVRIREFGVRFALGATPWSIVRLVISQGVRIALIGAPIGAAAAIAAGRAFSGLLFGVQPWDTGSLVAAAVGAILVAILASVVPAIIASRLSPAEALRK